MTIGGRGVKGEPSAMLKVAAFSVPASYIAGVCLVISVEYYRFWSAGGRADFAMADALQFAALWPLRAMVF